MGHRLFLNRQKVIWLLLWAAVIPGKSKIDASAGDWAAGAVHAEAASERGYDGSGVRIALLDTGVRSTHEVFEGASLEEGCDYTESPLGGTNDYLGHGTFLASILAAQPGNELGLCGIAPGAVIVPLKCFDGQTAPVSLLAQAVYDAVDVYDCDIIQMSWGLAQEEEVLLDAVNYALEQDVILVASAGNDGTDGLYYPAPWTGVIGVGAFDEEGSVSGYSQKNASTWIFAPGDPLVGAGHTSDAAKVTVSGTSYAAAYVAGAAAVALEAAPGLTGETFSEALRACSPENGEGALLLDIEALLEYLL